MKVGQQNWPKIIVGLASLVMLLILVCFFCWLNVKADQTIVADFASRSAYYTAINFNRQEAVKDKPKKIRMLFFGDIMLDRTVKKKIDSNGGVGYLLKNLSNDKYSFFSGYSVVAANLEGPVTNNGLHYPPVAEIDFAFNPQDVSQFKKYGFNFFSIANNHIKDQGQKGFVETQSNLNNLGFTFSGCSDAIIDECTSVIVQKEDKKIGLAGFSMVYNHFDLQAAKQKIIELKKQSDIVIANIHWGIEYQHQFQASQQQIAYALIDAGADAIVGTHPHVVQGIEVYKNKPIFYSLGNFVFDQYFSQDTQQGIAVGLTFVLPEENQKQLSWQADIFSLQGTGSLVTLMGAEKSQEYYKKIASWSVLSEEYLAQLNDGKLELIQ